MEVAYLLIPHIQYHCCWWLGDIRSQGIRTHGIDLLIGTLECFEFSTKWCNDSLYCNKMELHSFIHSCHDGTGNFSLLQDVITYPCPKYLPGAPTPKSSLLITQISNGNPKSHHDILKVTHLICCSPKQTNHRSWWWSCISKLAECYLGWVMKSTQTMECN